MLLPSYDCFVQFFVDHDWGYIIVFSFFLVLLLSPFLLLDKLGVDAIRIVLQQCLMIAHLFQLSHLQHQDLVGVLDGAQSVGDYDGCDVSQLLSDFVDSFLHGLLVLLV